jgi:hypothetical protein
VISDDASSENDRLLRGGTLQPNAVGHHS